MIKTLSIVLSLFLVSILAYSQTSADSLLQVGQTFYKKGDFKTAGKMWTLAAESANNKISRQANYFYAAHSYAEGRDSTNAFNCLELAIMKNGFNDLPALQDKETFGFMTTSKRWSKLVNSINPAYSHDPNKAKIVDTDVRNFWKAYDLVQNDTGNAVAIYKQNYIDKGSIALQDYFVNKMGGSVYYFNLFHKQKDKFYKSVRESTFKAIEYSPDFKKSFIKLKQIYPQAIFPNVYFVIGKLNSAGTSSSNGLILAIDQICKTKSTVTSELEGWQQHYLAPFSNLSATV
jgi:hypothetical protein